MTRGVVELIEDDSRIGEVLVVCVTDGTKYKQFTDKVGIIFYLSSSYVLHNISIQRFFAVKRPL